MRSTKHLTLLLAVLVSGACSNLAVPDLNAPSIGDLQTSPTRSSVATATQGLIAETRVNAGNMAAGLGAYAREGYNLDQSNPQAPANIYVALDQDQGGGFWTTGYRTMKTGNIILAAVDQVTGVTAAEKEGIRGFTKTMQALGLLQVITAMDANGAVLDAAANASDPLPAPATKAQVYGRILGLLDAAATHLAAAGGSFAFGVNAGMANFGTPANFLKFNKAIRARANIYSLAYSAALVDLGASFLDTGAPLTQGAYWNYSGNSGDAVNPIYDPTTRQRFAHPSFLAAAQLKADLTKDNRALTKAAPLTPLTRHGFPVSERLTVYNATDAAIPIIRNEELILLRAEANLALNNDATALTDINFIRQNAGGLAPIAGGTWTGLTNAQQLDELLYQKRYSLFWEIGTSWVDARNYGRLAQLPKDRAGDKVFPYFAWPSSECNQRAANRPPACTVPAGL